MFRKTIKAALFVGLCAFALGMVARPHTQGNRQTDKSYLNQNLEPTCECSHISINLIGECANTECPYYYGTLDW